MDWDFLETTIIANRLAGLAYWRLNSSSGGDLCSRQLIQSLEPHFITNQFVNLLLLKESERIFSELGAVGIEAIGLKGISLIEDIYPLGARKLGDLDILVSSKQAQNAIETLEHIGYQKQSEYQHRNGYIDISLHIGNHSIPIDLSWRFLHRSKFQTTHALTFTSIYHQRRFKHLSQVKMPILGLQDQVIHIACHGVLHHELNFLPGLVDLYAMLSIEANFDWESLRIRARRYGLWRSTLVAIGTLHELYQLPLSQAVISEWRELYAKLLRGPGMLFLDRFWVIGAEAESIVKSKHGGVVRNLARLWWNQCLSDSWTDRFKGIIKPLWPTPARVAKLYGQHSGPLAIVLQCLHIPLVLVLLVLLGPIFLIGLPILILWMRKQLAGRLIGSEPESQNVEESSANEL